MRVELGDLVMFGHHEVGEADRAAVECAGAVDDPAGVGAWCFLRACHTPTVIG